MGSLKTMDYRQSVLYTTLSHCDMCAGAIIFFTIPKVVIGENVNYQRVEAYLQSRGVEEAVLNDPGCIQMPREFDEHNPVIWNKGD